jgi:hypothetical protein
MGQAGTMYEALSEPWRVCSASTCTGEGSKAIPTVDEITLSIDGIYLTVDLSDAVLKRILKFIDEIPGPETPKSIPAFPFRKWHRRDYTTGFKAYLNNLLAWNSVGTGEFVCEIGPKAEGLKNTRFRWNPSKCDSSTVVALVFYDYLNVSPGCLLPATVSGIDIALDIPYVRVDHVALYYPKMRLIENKFSAGRTLYLGAQSGRTRVVAYDKAREIHYTNTKLGAYLAELHEKVPPHDLLRLEIQQTPGVVLTSLPDLSNLFLNLRVYGDLPELCPLARAWLALARYEGFPRATEITSLTPSQEKKFRRQLDKADQLPWWSPNVLWGQQYPSVISKFLMPFLKCAPHSNLSDAGYLTSSANPALIAHLAPVQQLETQSTAP